MARSLKSQVLYNGITLRPQITCSQVWSTPSREILKTAGPRLLAASSLEDPRTLKKPLTWRVPKELFALERRTLPSKVSSSIISTAIQQQQSVHAHIAGMTITQTQVVELSQSVISTLTKLFGKESCTQLHGEQSSMTKLAV